MFTEYNATALVAITTSAGLAAAISPIVATTIAQVIATLTVVLNF